MRAQGPQLRTESKNRSRPVSDTRGRSTVLPILGLIVFLALFVPAMSAGIGSVAQDRGPGTAVANESVTVSYNGSIAVAESGEAFSESVTVTRPQENATDDTLAAGTDYRWDDRRGEVTFLEGGNTTAGERLEIDYTAFAAPEETEQTLAFLEPIVAMAPWLLVLVTGGLALAFIREGWY